MSRNKKDEASIVAAERDAAKRHVTEHQRQVAMHRSLPVTTAELRALNERVTELRRKMPDDEPCTILARLHENGEFLWADEAHVEGALARLEEHVSATMATILGRVYNEVYCYRAYQTSVENAIMELAKQHPEWGLDMSRGAGNWEEADEGQGA